jgi:4-hydroxythreonine-4-phosphate dehydrogenase
MIRLAVTMGDPAGIGPEVLAAALRRQAKGNGAFFYVCGDKGILARSGVKDAANRRLIDPAPGSCVSVRPGRPSAVSARASLAYLEEAVRLIKNGTCDALVTGPISKEMVAAAGFPWPGHTEYLAQRFKADRAEMVFVAPPLSVVVVTRHMALRDAVRSLSTARIVSCGRAVRDLWREAFRIKHPWIAVCGLNPHAGEAGLFGDEEKRIIRPAIRQLNRTGGSVFLGPISPDTVFNRAFQGEFDLVMAMYHDQGLIPFKLLAFEQGVHLTAGLPFVRTSPVHGTAFEIAGKHRAKPDSMARAMALAARLAGNLRR